VNAATPWLEKSDAPAVVVVSSVSGREVDFTSPASAFTTATNLVIDGGPTPGVQF
jgi:hypothetical protein